MIRRSPSLGKLPTALSLVLAVVIATASPRAAQAKSYHAERYRTEIRVQADGSLRIREEIRVRFKGGPFTFFYRGLPLRRTEGIVDLTSPDSIEVRQRRSRLDVTWRFSPARDTVRAFTFEYTARGAVKFDARADQIRWWAFPKARSYDIEEASAVLVLPPGWPAATNLRTEPEGIDFRVVTTPDHAPALQEPVHPEAVLIALGPTSLRENRSVILQADLEPGYVQGEVPGWQARERHWRERMPASILLASFILTIGLFWVFWSRSYLTAQLDRGAGWSPPGGKVFALTSPPDDASPALVGVLTSGVVASVPLLATLFDLARRGLVRVEVGSKRHTWSTAPIHLSRGRSENGLPEWEQIALDAAFRRAGDDGRVAWSRATYEVQKSGSTFLQSAREELIRRGDLDPQAFAARRALYYRASGFIGLAVALFAIAAGIFSTLGPFGLLPGVAAVLVAAGALACGGTLHPHTAQGAQRVRQWRGFARFLTEAAKGTTPIDAARFHHWLPLAVALGVAPAWVKAGKRWGLSTPEWFRSPAGDIAALLVVVTAGSAHGGGGGGAGGGGSSGAG